MDDMSLVVCAALSVAGIAIALLTAWRRRFRRATVILGLALIPIGLQLTGLVTMFGKIGTAFGKWASALAFDSRVWIGFAVLAVAVVLLVVGKLTGGRGRTDTRRERRRKKKERGVTSTAGGPAAPAASTPAGQLPGDRRAPQPTPTGKSSGKDDDMSDFAEIEEILKRRGI